jgi:hypothetical protein
LAITTGQLYGTALQELQKPNERVFLLPAGGHGMADFEDQMSHGYPPGFSSYLPALGEEHDGNSTSTSTRIRKRLGA